MGSSVCRHVNKQSDTHTDLHAHAPTRQVRHADGEGVVALRVCVLRQGGNARLDYTMEEGAIFRVWMLTPLTGQTGMAGGLKIAPCFILMQHHDRENKTRPRVTRRVWRVWRRFIVAVTTENGFLHGYPSWTANKEDRILSSDSFVVL
ncbi:hypothetical protein Bbelb_402620 [Branchiostoma belcheri]|nr:hypothetical protein Bbelb_402620 [Branchiostoma belcheri]